MTINRISLAKIMMGTALVAACSGKLDVNDAKNNVASNGGDAGAGGANGGAGSADASTQNGGQAGSPAPAGGGGNAGGGGVAGGAGNGGTAGGAGSGGIIGCYSGPDTSAGGLGAGGGNTGTGGVSGGSVSPTCPLDGNGFATVDLTAVCDGTVHWATGTEYPCATSSADLLRGLQCDEVTTNHEGFTRTVGCGFETVEFLSYQSRTTYDLEEDYAASYDLTTGTLSGVSITEPSQFGPCLSYSYKAGTLPGACPAAVTYKCNRIPKGDATDAAYAGCRAPGDPGCTVCCQSSAGDPNSCTDYTSSNQSTDYENGEGQNHACACGCKPCAQCSLEDERNYRVVAPHPECNCKLPPAGDPCASWCSFLTSEQSVCPGL